MRDKHRGGDGGGGGGGFLISISEGWGCRSQRALGSWKEWAEDRNSWESGVGFLMGSILQGSLPLYLNAALVLSEGKKE